jgi:hypothetical protein
MPNDQKSTARSYGLPFNISGDINKGVPQAVVIKVLLDILANPKSAIFKTASSSFVDHNIFSGYILVLLYFYVSMNDIIRMTIIKCISQCSYYLTYLCLCSTPISIF